MGLDIVTSLAAKVLLSMPAIGVSRWCDPRADPRVEERSDPDG